MTVICKKALCLCLLLVFCCSLFCCGNTQRNENADRVIFKDALGREVSVPKNTTQAAALLGSFAEIWQLAGGTLCAAAEDAWEDFGLDMGDAINIGGAHSPGLELLVSSCPQLVIASASTASNVAMKEALESMGITVAYFDVDNFYDYLAMLEICTDITGRKDLYKQNGEDIKSAIEAIKDEYINADIPENEKKILLLRAFSSTVKAKGSKGTVLGEMLSDMGCINIADNDQSLLENLSVEAVIKEEPYHIFAVTMGSNTEAAKASIENMIKENPAWSSLEAIKQGRLHIMEKQLFNFKPNVRWAQAYEKLYEKLINN